MPRDLCMKYYITAIAILVVDQVSKLMVRTDMRVGQSIAIIGDFFKLTYVRNSGAAFSMLSGMRIFLIVLPIAAIIICLWYLAKHKAMHQIGKFALVFIISGGVGNLIDRTFMGPVTDMFDFSIFPPVFNVADIAVTVGCVLLIVYVLFEERLNKIK